MGIADTYARSLDVANLKEETAVEGMQQSESTQGMPGMQGSLLDRLQAAVSQDSERARETINQVRSEVQNLSADQKEQLRSGVEQLQARMQNLTDEQKQQIQEIVEMIRR